MFESCDETRTDLRTGRTCSHVISQLGESHCPEKPLVRCTQRIELHNPEPESDFSTEASIQGILSVLTNNCLDRHRGGVHSGVAKIFPSVGRGLPEPPGQ